MKTKLEILTETYLFYHGDVSRRAVVKGNCKYHTEDGRRCAIGRCIEGKEMNHFMDRIKYDESANPIFQPYMIPYMKENYQINDVEFWLDVQKFHDCPSYWEYYGLTNLGEIAYQKLLVKYARNSVS